MIAITTTISSSVKPRAPRRAPMRSLLVARDVVFTPHALVGAGRYDLVVVLAALRLLVLERIRPSVLGHVFLQVRTAPCGNAAGLLNERIETLGARRVAS